MGCGSSNSAVPPVSNAPRSSTASSPVPAAPTSKPVPPPVDRAIPTSSPNLPPKIPASEIRSNRSERGSNITVSDTVVSGAAKASVASKVEAETADEDEDDESDVEEADNTKKTTLQFATEFMLALIPTPDNLADVLSEKTVSKIHTENAFDLFI